MQLSFKWKLFRFANYLMAFIFLFFLCFLINSIIKDSIESDTISWVILALIGIVLIIFNSIFNLFLSYKRFPNKIIQGKTKSIYIISTVFYLIALLGLLVLSLFGLNEELKEPDEDKTGLIAAIVLLSLFVIGCYIFIMQLLVRRFLEVNYKSSINSLIESIGEE
jgi:carbon starvation protein CstA